MRLKCFTHIIKIENIEIIQSIRRVKNKKDIHFRVYYLSAIP